MEEKDGNRGAQKESQAQRDGRGTAPLRVNDLKDCSTEGPTEGDLRRAIQRPAGAQPHHSGYKQERQTERNPAEEYAGPP